MSTTKLKMKRDFLARFLFHLIAIFIFLQSNSQDLVPGWIVGTNSDTIKGYVHIKSKKAAFQKVRFHNTSYSKQEYGPNDIIAYGIINSFSYQSGLVNGSFAKTLVSGDISLFRINDIYSVVYKGDTLTFAETQKEVSQFKVLKSDIWKKRLELFLSDCSAVSSRISKLTYNEDQLKKIIMDYAECAGISAKSFKSLGDSELSFGPIIGVLNSNTRVRSGETLHVWSPSIGFFLRRSLSRRFGLQGEIHIYGSSWEERTSENSTSTLFVNTGVREYSFTRVLIPLSIEFRKTFVNSSLGFGIGPNIEFSIKNNFENYRETLNTSSGEITQQQRSEDMPSNGGMGFFGALNYEKSLKQFRIGFRTAILQQFQNEDRSTNVKALVYRLQFGTYLAF